MDYGKMAYLKVEELRAQLNVKSQMAEGGARLAFYPKYNFEAGKYSFTTLSASGLVTLILKIKIRRDKDLSGSVKLTVSNFCASIQDVSGSKGEQDYLILASISVNGFADIILEPSIKLEATLISAELVCIGADAKLSGGLNNWNADYFEQTSAVALTRDEQIFVAKISNNVLGEVSNSGRGHILDIVGIDNGFSLAFCDDLNNMWGVRFDINLIEKSRRFLGTACEAVTLASFNNRLVMASLKQGVVNCRSCDVDFGGLSVGSELDIGVKAEDIRFVKHAKIPMLTALSGGVEYLKFAVDEPSVATSFKITSKFTYSKI